jgi:hypothetical protein
VSDEDGSKGKSEQSGCDSEREGRLISRTTSALPISHEHDLQRPILRRRVRINRSLTPGSASLREPEVEERSRERDDEHD